MKFERMSWKLGIALFVVGVFFMGCLIVLVNEVLP